MNLNLHGTVRGAINSVNQDILMAYLQSTGNTVGADGTQNPDYVTPATIWGQAQPIGNQDLKKYAFLQAAGIYKSVHLYGDVENIVRSAQLGGDLLQFPNVPNGPIYTWLIRVVPETWNPGWCRVIVSMQLDPNNPVT
jgi:hypothetical protein